MKDLNELPELMTELIDTVDTCTGIPKFPARATEIVKEIAAYARGTSIYQDSRKSAENFWADGTLPEPIYGFMLRKIVHAPATLHRDFSVLLHMPALEKALDAQRRCRVCGCSDYNACVPTKCHWTELNLCSECAKREATVQELVQESLLEGL